MLISLQLVQSSPLGLSSAILGGVRRLYKRGEAQDRDPLWRRREDVGRGAGRRGKTTDKRKGEWGRKKRGLHRVK